MQLTLLLGLENKPVTYFKKGKRQSKQKQEEENHCQRNLEQTQRVCCHVWKRTEAMGKTTNVPQASKPTPALGRVESLPVFSCVCSSTLGRLALCNLLDIFSLMWWKEGSRELSSLFFSLTGENLTHGRKLVSCMTMQAQHVGKAFSLEKITSWYDQIPALHSINNLFKGVSTTTCTL